MRYFPTIAAILITVAFTGSALTQQPSRSAKWTKSYVVEWNEPAVYYGAKTGVIDPGTDCPQGTNPEIDWIKVLVDAGYTVEEAKWLRNPANPRRSPVHGQNQMAFRGKDRANVYVSPTSTPDPGLVGVSGTIADGLNLNAMKAQVSPVPRARRASTTTFTRLSGAGRHIGSRTGSQAGLSISMMLCGMASGPLSSLLLARAQTL